MLGTSASVLPVWCSGAVGRELASSDPVSDLQQVQQILTYEDSVAAHLSKILTSDQHSVVISSAKYAEVLCRQDLLGGSNGSGGMGIYLINLGGLSNHALIPRVLCETVKDFVARIGKAYEKNRESSEESEAMARKVQDAPP